MKNFLIFIGIVLLIGGGFGIYILSKTSNIQDKPNTTQEKTNANNTTASMNNAASSNYIEYSKTALEQNSEKRRILFFYANWCPTCRPADAGFRENENKIPEDVVVVRINYNDTDTDNEEKELAKKYAITYQHTYVQIDQEGNIITKWNGGGIDELLTNIK